LIKGFPKIRSAVSVSHTETGTNFWEKGAVAERLSFLS
jgi:hypothetical protein